MTRSEQPDQTMSRPSPAERKRALRSSVRAARAARSAAERAAFARQLAEWSPPAGTRRVSCFVGVGDEPDTGPLLERLTAAGVEVLLPVTLSDFSLDWSAYTGRGDLAAARFGLLEPTGPRLGPEAIGSADVVLIPALAVDRDGRRLGQGAGCYDRALLHVPTSTPVLAVVHQEERLVENLPEEPHDRRVDGVIP